MFDPSTSDEVHFLQTCLWFVWLMYYGICIAKVGLGHDCLLINFWGLWKVVYLQLMIDVKFLFSQCNLVSTTRLRCMGKALYAYNTGLWIWSMLYLQKFLYIIHICFSRWLHYCAIFLKVPLWSVTCPAEGWWDELIVYSVHVSQEGTCSSVGESSYPVYGFLHSNKP